MDEPFPVTLKEFGYAFNDGEKLCFSVAILYHNFTCVHFQIIDGQLRAVDPQTGLPGDKPFEFHVKDNQNYNQKRYEALGEVCI